MLALGQEFFSNNSLFVSTNAIDCPSYKHRLLQSVHLCIFLIFTCSPFFWRRKWQPTPVFLPRESCEQRSLVYGVAQSQTRLKQLSTHTCIGKGNGNPLLNSCLENSCLENPRDKGAWWAAVYGVAQSRT